ncbi:MAG: V-type ATP synthase subunit E [Spirochaetaceae bacterium]|nr:V-type ATP synthase subunit E [Spirochaetaceae bacterium]MBO4727306.1 V-type ATP synthase subunit E [Spirochaetaceae bacterium]MBO7136391.1 V-type ATP synthase subunit E [Spirochaetaceae bacterium]MBO7420666.1 V-type ATP synthase subunit E [Spirochaetaceae bacterium]MBR4826179.1 V-type ATP synthase subunit E [Spirochaetaceae bacterium]
MDVQLQELIDKIKKDGVGAAEASAQAIIADAEKRAEAIVAEAERKALENEKKAKAEAERLEKASIDAIKQAARNTILSFRDGINAELSALIQAETAKSYDDKLLKTLIPEVVKEWVKNPDAASISVLLSEKDTAALSSSLTAALKSEIAKGLEIKADSSLDAGFRISTKDGAAYYDFSAESVAALFSAYLNPKTAQIMKDAAGGIQ